MVDFDQFIALARSLERHKVDYVLVGGMALGLHGLVRATKDIDLFVRPDPANVERLKAALRSVWNDPEIELIRADELAGDYPTIRYGPPNESFVIDLISRLGEAVTFDSLQAQAIPVEGVEVRVATPRALFEMKKDTIRPIDRADAAALSEKFGFKE